MCSHDIARLLLNLSQSSQSERQHADFVRLVQTTSSDSLRLVQDATLYKEVKDIQEELNMLRPVYNSQAEAIKMLRAACEDGTTIVDPQSLIDAQNGCDDRLRSLARLQAFARETSEAKLSVVCVTDWFAAPTSLGFEAETGKPQHSHLDKTRSTERRAPERHHIRLHHSHSCVRKYLIGSDKTNLAMILILRRHHCPS